MFFEALGSFGSFLVVVFFGICYHFAMNALNVAIGNTQEKFKISKFFLIAIVLYFVYMQIVYILVVERHYAASFYFCLIPGIFAIIMSIAKFFKQRMILDNNKKVQELIDNPFLREHASFQTSDDNSQIRKHESASTKTPDLLAELNKSGKDGMLVAFSTNNLGPKEKEKEIEHQKSWSSNGEFHKLGWRSSIEDRSIIVGVPGSGKTTYLISQIVDWMSSGRSFVATDIKPEIWSILKENGIFERFGYSDYVINPTSKNADRFNMFAEIENDADLNEVLSVIIEVGSGDSAVFNDNARRLLKAVLSHLGERASLPAARDFISECGGTDDMLDALMNSDKKSVQRIAREVKSTAGNDRLMASILTTMNKAFEFLDDETISDAISESDFKMKDVLAREKVAVFLQFEQKYKNSVATLFGATVSYVLRILQSNMNERKSSVFIALDEIINAAPIPKFSEFLNTIRSCKMPLAMYLQSIEGLNKLYGPGSDALFIGSSDLKVFFRINDNQTAGFVSLQSGETIERNKGTSSSGTNIPFILTGENGSDDSFSVSRSYSRTSVVDAHDVLSLPPGVAIILYRGKVGQLQMPSYYKDFPMPNRASDNPRKDNSLKSVE